MGGGYIFHSAASFPQTNHSKLVSDLSLSSWQMFRPLQLGHTRILPKSRIILISSILQMQGGGSTQRDFSYGKLLCESDSREDTSLNSTVLASSIQWSIVISPPHPQNLHFVPSPLSFITHIHQNHCSSNPVTRMAIVLLRLNLMP